MTPRLACHKDIISELLEFLLWSAGNRWYGTQLAEANLAGSIQLVGSMNGIAACKKPIDFDARHA